MTGFIALATAPFVLFCGTLIVLAVVVAAVSEASERREHKAQRRREVLASGRHPSNYLDLQPLYNWDTEGDFR